MDCGYCIETLLEIYKKTSHSDPIYVTLLRHFIRFLTCHQFLTYATIFILTNDWWEWQNSLCWQCMAYYTHPWNSSNENTWPLTIQVIMHGRRVPNPCNVSRVAAHDVLLSPFLPPGKRWWNSYPRNKSIGFDNSYCIYKPVVYRVQYYINFATRLMLKPK